MGVWADELDAARAVQKHLLQQIEKVAPMLQILSNSLSCNLTTHLHAASAAKQEGEQAHCSQETQDAPAEVLGGKGDETAATACAADHLPLLRERPPLNWECHYCLHCGYQLASDEGQPPKKQRRYN